jgi:hypothetical protein
VTRAGRNQRSCDSDPHARRCPTLHLSPPGAAQRRAPEPDRTGEDPLTWVPEATCPEGDPRPGPVSPLRGSWSLQFTHRSGLPTDRCSAKRATNLARERAEVAQVESQGRCAPAPLPQAVTSTRPRSRASYARAAPPHSPPRWHRPGRRPWSDRWGPLGPRRPRLAWAAPRHGRRPPRRTKKSRGAGGCRVRASPHAAQPARLAREVPSAVTAAGRRAGRRGAAEARTPSRPPGDAHAEPRAPPPGPRPAPRAPRRRPQPAAGEPQRPLPAAKRPLLSARCPAAARTPRAVAAGRAADPRESTHAVRLGSRPQGRGFQGMRSAVPCLGLKREQLGIPCSRKSWGLALGRTLKGCSVPRSQDPCGRGRRFGVFCLFVCLFVFPRSRLMSVH